MSVRKFVSFAAPCFVFVLGSAMAQAPALSPIELLPGDTEIGPAAGEQRRPVIAAGGSQSLLVWEEDRTTVDTTLIAEGSATDIYATRLDAFGVPLEAVPFVVTQAFGEQVNPKVAWNGSEWLVTFVSQIPTMSFYTDEIQAVRVSPQGLVLDPVPISVEEFANGSNAELFGVASDGSDFAVAWKDWTGSSWSIRARRVTAQGALVGAAPINVVTNVPSQPYNGEIAFALDEYLIVWNHWVFPGQDNVFGRRVTPTLGALGGTITIASSADYDVHPAIATDGTDFLVAWESYDTCCACGGGVVGAARVTHAGVVLDNPPIPVLSYCAITIGREVTTAFDGTNWVIGWTDERFGIDSKIAVARVSPQGQVLDPNGLDVDPTATSRHERAALVGAPGGGTLVAWQDARGGGAMPYDVYLAPFSSAGQPGFADCVSLGAPAQTQPDLAANGGGHLAVFLSGVSGKQRVVGQQLDAAGNALDSEPFEIAAFGTNVRDPAVAWNGSMYFVAWADGQIMGRRLGPGGAPLDAAPFVVMPGTNPQVAAVGDTFLVVATHAPSNPHFRFPYARRVSGATGALLDGAPILLGQYFAGNMDVTAIGPRFLAVWQRNFSHDDPHSEVIAAFVEVNGTTPGNFIVAGGYAFQSVPVVASDGTDAFVAWQDQTVSTLKADIRGRQVFQNGSMAASFLVSGAPNPQSLPAIAFDGAEYVTAFQDMRNIATFFDVRYDLYGARVSSGGVLLDANGFAIATDPRPEIHPAVAGFDGAALIAGATYTTDGATDAYRIGVSVMNAACQAPVEAYGAGCAGSGGVTPALAVIGCPVAGGTVTLAVSNGLPNGTALLFFGFAQGTTPLPGGCALLVTPLLPAIFPAPLAADGAFSIGATIPATAPHVTVTLQALIPDAGVPRGYSATNGAQLTVP